MGSAGAADRDFIQSLVLGLEQRLVAHMRTSTAELFREYDCGVQRRFEAIERQALGADARLAELERGAREQRTEIEEMRRQMAMDVAAPPPENTASFDYDRAPDAGLVKMRSNAAFAIEEACALAKSIGESAALAEDAWVVRGDQLGRVFDVRMCGDPGLAARRAGKFLSSLRGPDGSWRDTSVPLPGGGQTRVFVGPDKSRRQVQLEVAGKRALAACKEVLPTRPWFLRRRDGVLSADWVPLAKVEVDEHSPPRLKWNLAPERAVATEHRQSIEEAFARLTADGAQAVSWG